MAVQLLQLPEECLVQIFENLAVAELGVAASVCTRLQIVARRVFRTEHQPTTVAIDVSLFCHNATESAESNARFQLTPAIFYHFGDLMAKLKLTFNRSNNKENFPNTYVLNLISVHCTGGLETLQLIDCGYLHPDATAIFRNVKELILDQSEGIDFSLLSDAQKLMRVDLRIYANSYLRASLYF